LKHIDTLVEDIYDLFTRDGGPPIPKEQVDKEVDIFLGELKEHLTDFLYTKKRTSSNLRLSLIGKPARQTWYEINKNKENEVPLSAPTRIKFLYGHLLESLLLLFTSLSGHTVTGKQKELMVEGVAGHQDCIIDDVVVDCKSASPYSFKKFSTGQLTTDDPFGYVGQLSAYTQAQQKNEAAFLAIDKSNGDIALLKLHDMEMIDANERVKYLKKIIRQDTPPDKCYGDLPDGVSGNRKLAIGCVYCPHKRECWSDANEGKGLRLFKYAKGTRFLSNVAKVPDVEEIVEW